MPGHSFAPIRHCQFEPTRQSVRKQWIRNKVSIKPGQIPHGDPQLTNPESGCPTSPSLLDVLQPLEVRSKWLPIMPIVRTLNE